MDRTSVCQRSWPWGVDQRCRWLRRGL